MYTIFLCFRYLRKRRIAIFGVGAVAFCVGLLIVVTSVFEGFIRLFEGYMRNTYGDVTLYVPPMREYGPLADALEKVEGVETARPEIGTAALAYFGRGDVRSVMISGVDLARECRNETFRKGFLRQSAGKDMPAFELNEGQKAAAMKWVRQRKADAAEADLPGGAIGGIGLFGQPDEKTDSYDLEKISELLNEWERPLILTTMRRTDDPTQPGVKVQMNLWPVDAVETGVHELDTEHMYLPLEYLLEKIGLPGPDGKKECWGQAAIRLKPGVKLSQVREKIQDCWNRFGADRGWDARKIERAELVTLDENSGADLFLHEIRKQMRIMQLIVGLVCLVSGFLVLIILMMVAAQKRRDMGIVRSLGGSQAGMAGIFMGFGFLVGLAGSLGGLLLGMYATHHINTIELFLTKLTGFKIWKSGVYMFREIPNQVAWENIWYILLIGIVAAMLGAILPAIKAARQQPVVSLRYE